MLHMEFHTALIWPTFLLIPDYGHLRKFIRRKVKIDKNLSNFTDTPIIHRTMDVDCRCI